MSTSALPVKAERFSFFSSWRLNTVYTVFKHHDFFILFILEKLYFWFCQLYFGNTSPRAYIFFVE